MHRLILLCIALVQCSPLRIGYSDWPGWIAWDVGVNEGWFAEKNLSVEFVWADYLATLSMFDAGEVDAVCNLALLTVTFRLL
jgi:NitT/TauT family transport system substrate-binding protein